MTTDPESLRSEEAGGPPPWLAYFFIFMGVIAVITAGTAVWTVFK